jgi:hypothetical protein
VIVLVPVDDERMLDRNVWTAMVRFRAGFTCEDCGGKPARLHAHHLNGDDSDNRLANGRCLCVACHGARHPDWRTKRWEGSTEEERRAHGRRLAAARAKKGVTAARKCEPGCTCGKHRKVAA